MPGSEGKEWLSLTSVLHTLGLKPPPISLLQAEYRLCNGSEKESMSPTARVSKKETLKVGTCLGREERHVQEFPKVGTSDCQRVEHTPRPRFLCPHCLSSSCPVPTVAACWEELGNLEALCDSLLLYPGPRHRRRTTGRRRSELRSNCSVR